MVTEAEMSTHILGESGLTMCRTKDPVIKHGGAFVADCTDCLRIECARGHEMENRAVSAGLHATIVEPSENEAVRTWARFKGIPVPTLAPETCPECGHRHSVKFGGICIGCLCKTRPAANGGG